MNKMTKKAFTLIELIAVLVILAVIALIVTPLVLNIIKSAKKSANERSVDAYGKAVELAMQSYKLEHGKYTYDFNDLNIEYSGNKVTCDEIVLNENGSIFITKCQIGGKYVEDKKTDDGYYQYGEIKPDYVIGDIVIYNDIKFYVISNSTKLEDYVTLLKAEPLTVEEVNTYGVGHVNRYTGSSVGTATNRGGYGAMAYYSSETCGYSGSSYSESGCITDYDQSDIKYVVDNWSNSIIVNDDLATDNLGYKVRLITTNELVKNLKYSGFNNRQPSSETPEWVHNSNYYYWTMDEITKKDLLVSTGNTGPQIWNVCDDYLNTSYVITTGYYVVRPVVNLRKSAIE